MSTLNCPKCGTSLMEGGGCPHCKALKIDFKFVSCCSPSFNYTDAKDNSPVSAPSIQKEGGGKDAKR